MARRVNHLAEQLIPGGKVVNPWRLCKRHEFLYIEIQRDDASYDKDPKQRSRIENMSWI